MDAKTRSLTKIVNILTESKAPTNKFCDPMDLYYEMARSTLTIYINYKLKCVTKILSENICSGYWEGL